MKICSKCCEEKELTEFYKNMGRCKTCHNQMVRKWQVANPVKVVEARNRWRAEETNRTKEREASKTWQRNNKNQVKENRLKQQLKFYGLTVEQYEEMNKNQNGFCYICGKLPNRRLDVDHNHETGKVRKLLCSSCNTLIGLSGESIEVLTKIISYLQTHRK